MVKHNALALLFIVGGVLANNYAYLHDVLTNTHGGAIYMGLSCYIGVLISLIIVAIGVTLLIRGPKNG